MAQCPFACGSLSPSLQTSSPRDINHPTRTEKSHRFGIVILIEHSRFSYLSAEGYETSRCDAVVITVESKNTWGRKQDVMVLSGRFIFRYNTSATGPVAGAFVEYFISKGFHLKGQEYSPLLLQLLFVVVVVMVMMMIMMVMAVPKAVLPPIIVSAVHLVSTTSRSARSRVLIEGARATCIAAAPRAGLPSRNPLSNPPSVHAPSLSVVRNNAAVGASITRTPDSLWRMVRGNASGSRADSALWSVCVGEGEGKGNGEGGEMEKAKYNIKLLAIFSPMWRGGTTRSYGNIGTNFLAVYLPCMHVA